MLTDLFGNSPRVRLLDFLADHVDYDYTLTQMHRLARVSRPTLYRLVAALQKEGLIMPTREVGGSHFFRLATENPKVVAMLQMDFRQVNEELAADRFGSGGAAGGSRLSIAHRILNVSCGRRLGTSSRLRLCERVRVENGSLGTDLPSGAWRL